jgi:hypothetical protein
MEPEGVMTAIEDARAALVYYESGIDHSGESLTGEGPLKFPAPDPVERDAGRRLATAIRTLIAEHDRLTADLALYQEHAGLTFPRPLKFAPTTDAQVDAAYDAFYESIHSAGVYGQWRTGIRAALEAARDAGDAS